MFKKKKNLIKLSTDNSWEKLNQKIIGQLNDN